MAAEKNKIIIGAVSRERSNRDAFFESLGIHAFTEDWEILYMVLDRKTGEVSSLAPTRQRYGFMPNVTAVGSRLYAFGKQILDDVAPESDRLESESDVKQIARRSKKDKKKEKRQIQKLIPGLSWSYSLDMTKPERGWRLAAAADGVGDDRYKPRYVLSFGGKIYVFRDTESAFSCEVFDHHINKWFRIKSPPVGGLQLTPPIMADHKNNRIIACFNEISTMFAYYPCEDQWRCVVQDFRGWSELGEPVTLADDGVIYVHNPRYEAFFRAYDLATKQWLNVRLSPHLVGDDYKSYLIYDRYFNLLHMGNGLLCLLLALSPLHLPDESPPLHPQPTIKTFIHILQFKVEIHHSDSNYKEVLVTPLSSQKYNLPYRCHPFLYLPH